MKRSAMVLAAGIIALALVACAPAPPPAPGGGLLSTSRLGPACPVETFLAKVHFLAAPPAFSLPGSGYESGPPIDNTPVGDGIRRSLAAAFSAAPPFFKAQLCDLSGIY